jgi:hypothetical protein
VKNKAIFEKEHYHKKHKSKTSLKCGLLKLKKHLKSMEFPATLDLTKKT